MKNSGLLFLNAVLSETASSFFEKELRAPLYLLQTQLEPFVRKYTNDRTVIYLCNESVEKEANGQKTLQMPDLPIRDKETGNDDKFKAEVSRIMAIRNTIETEIETLNNTKVDIKIERILTDEQFDKIALDLKLPIEWEGLRGDLVKR